MTIWLKSLRWNIERKDRAESFDSVFLSTQSARVVRAIYAFSFFEKRKGSLLGKPFFLKIFVSYSSLTIFIII